MYVLIVSVICAVMLATVRQLAYNNLLENVVIAFLLFIVIDTGLRSLIGKPSWVLSIGKD